jgi:hypothetical protein
VDPLCLYPNNGIFNFSARGFDPWEQNIDLGFNFEGPQAQHVFSPLAWRYTTVQADGAGNYCCLRLRDFFGTLGVYKVTFDGPVHHYYAYFKVIAPPPHPPTPKP